MSTYAWIPCSARYGPRAERAYEKCSALARWLVVGGMDAGFLVCGNHRRAYTKVQFIEYPR